MPNVRPYPIRKANAKSPVSVRTAFVALGYFPVWCLLDVLPAWYIRDAVRWATSDPSRAVPMGAVAGNVFWNLGTPT